MVSLKTELQKKVAKTKRDIEKGAALQKAADRAREKKHRQELPAEMKTAIENQVKKADSWAFSKGEGVFMFQMATDKYDYLSHGEREEAFEKALKKEKFKILKKHPRDFDPAEIGDGYSREDTWTTTWEVEI